MDEKEAEARPVMGTIFLVIAWLRILYMISPTASEVERVKIEYE